MPAPPSGSEGFYSFEDQVVHSMPADWRVVWNDLGQKHRVRIVDGGVSDRHYLSVSVSGSPNVLSPSVSYPNVAAVYDGVVAEDMEQLYLLERGSQYANFVLRGNGDAYAGHTCYMIGWWNGFNVKFDRVVQQLSLIHISEPTRPY